MYTSCEPNANGRSPNLKSQSENGFAIPLVEMLFGYTRQDSNLRLLVPETNALSTELRVHSFSIVPN